MEQDLIEFLNEMLDAEWRVARDCGPKRPRFVKAEMNPSRNQIILTTELEDSCDYWPKAGRSEFVFTLRSVFK